MYLLKKMRRNQNIFDDDGIRAEYPLRKSGAGPRLGIKKECCGSGSAPERKAGSIFAVKIQELSRAPNGAMEGRRRSHEA